MCGRYQLGVTHEFSEHGPSMPVVEWVRDLFGVELQVTLKDRLNIAPTQNVLAIRRAESGFEAKELRWGLLPFWAKDKKAGASMINARGETVATKPAFRAAFKARRCVIPATAFVEWEQGTKPKQPWRILMRSREPFGMAGLWESWVDKATGEVVETCAIVTTDANELIAPMHDRMPVILPKRAVQRWLDFHAKPEELQGMLVPYPADEMERYRISTVINAASGSGAACVEPIV